MVYELRSIDPQLMKESGTRKIKQLSENTFILTDVVTGDRGTISKTRLVKLYPTERLWTSTTITGVRTYSQFLYRITSDGKDRSHLDFFGLQSGTPRTNEETDPRRETEDKKEGFHRVEVSSGSDGKRASVVTSKGTALFPEKGGAECC